MHNPQHTLWPIRCISAREQQFCISKAGEAILCQARLHFLSPKALLVWQIDNPFPFAVWSVVCPMSLFLLTQERETRQEQQTSAYTSQAKGKFHPLGDPEHAAPSGLDPGSPSDLIKSRLMPPSSGSATSLLASDASQMVQITPSSVEIKAKAGPSAEPLTSDGQKHTGYAFDHPGFESFHAEEVGSIPHARDRAFCLHMPPT
jgi:hypothetical protein